jgi:acyl carrier protein
MSEKQTEPHMALESRKLAVAAFPAAEVESCIREALSTQATIQAVLRPPQPAAWEPEIDSLVVVEVICSIEELLGISLPADFAPRGGYQSTEECVGDLVAQTKGAWIELTKQEQTHEG